MDYPVMDYAALERGFKELAWWSIDHGKPDYPELIPGLPGLNMQRLEAYRALYVAWRVGTAERLMYGLDERYRPR